MDETNTLSDAEMRLITINGQTIMLEGDFENVNMTNEFLNEMLLLNNSKVVANDGCNAQLNVNSNVSSAEEINDEPTKLQITIQGENNELQTVQIGIEEAKALGLYFYGAKEDGLNLWEKCMVSSVEEQMEEDDDEVVNGHSAKENCRARLHSVPVVSLNCLNGEQGGLVSVNEIAKIKESTDDASKTEKLSKVEQEDNLDNLPAIGQIEGFQIPIAENGMLLPAIANARMADGSCQTVTLIPQIINGEVMFTVHFSGDKTVKNSLNYKDHFSELINNTGNLVNKESVNGEVGSIEQFPHIVDANKKVQMKNAFPEIIQKLSDNKNLVSSFIKPTDESIKKIVKSDDSSGKNLSVNYTVQNPIPIEAKIDNLISENESVISKCKKVKYGKKLKTSDTEDSSLGSNKAAKSNIAKAKKVKFKNREIKFSNEGLEDLKLKLSLLKQKQVLNKRKNKNNNKSSNINLVSRMNLNGRLEYPNLNAIDETASPLTYFKVKTSRATKQPYFNVLPYPKDKAIPVQKHIFPLNCDFQQAKNIIGLQKLLDTQKLQLKIQPIVSNGSKIINIRPKPTSSDEVKTSNLGVNLNKLNIKKTDMINLNHVRENEIQTSQEDESVKTPYQENIKMKDVLIGDGKSNSLKFLKPDNNEEDEKETSVDSTNKLNGIFIKNNPEYFSQKSKDGKAEEHPLGSSENPIQLVQTGHTFHSRQPLSETQLRQIASILQKQKFDLPNVKKNSIFDPKTNTRIVYRVVYPEDVELKDGEGNSTEGIAKKKRGRHKTVKPSLGEEEIQKKLSPIPRGPGRPKKTPMSTLDEDIIEEEIEDNTPKKKIPRTRSGRLSRPPRYMVKDYKRLNNSDLSEKTFNSNYDSDEAYGAYENGKKVSLESTENITDLELEANLLSGLRPQQRSKRNFKPEYRCPTCQKIYLGHTRMMWHLNKFPDHCNVEKYKENYYRKRTETKVRRAARRLNLCDVTNKVKQVLNSMSKDELTSLCGPILAEALTIWDFLLLRVNLLKATRKDEVDALLHELVILLEKLTKIAEDIFLPVFTKEAEKEEDCVKIDRMEVAIALGLPVGFYKVNNDNLNLLRLPLKDTPQEPKDNEEMITSESQTKVENENLFSEKPEEKQDLFLEKPDPWDDDKNSKKLEEDSFWLESKVEDSDGWHPPEVKTLSTKFEPNLSTKLLESSNDSIDLDSNSKDIEQSNSSGNMDESPEIREHSKISQMEEKTQEPEGEEKHPGLWNENSTDKVSSELWNESSDMVQSKAATDLWTNENSEMAPTREKPLWNENSNEKVDETNSEFLDSLLSVPNSNEFLGNETSEFLSENISLMEDKSKGMKGSKAGDDHEEKREWRNDEEQSSYWETGKNPPWQKEEAILSERLPGVRTTSRLTSTPETNAAMSFNIPNRRNSISDFTNINLEPANLDMVLPPAKTLIKDRLKDDKRKFDMKEESFLESADNFKVKNWEADSAKQDFAATNVNSEELMKMALESLTSQHDVINVPSSSFDSAMGILNQSQEPGNLNLFTSSETDGLDFNLPLPDHLLRGNFSESNFQTTCASNFPSSESSAFLTTSNNIFETSCTNSMKFDQFEGNFSEKKSKPLDDVIEFFNTKNSFNRFENDSSNMNNFPFDSGSREAFAVGETPAEVTQAKKPTKRTKKPKTGRAPKPGKKPKTKKTVDYPKSKTIESIINEALFDSCASNSKPLQIKDSSPSGNSAIPDRSDNYSLPIISESLDEVGNLDFLNQD